MFATVFIIYPTDWNKYKFIPPLNIFELSYHSTQSTGSLGYLPFFAPLCQNTPQRLYSAATYLSIPPLQKSQLPISHIRNTNGSKVHLVFSTVLDSFVAWGLWGAPRETHIQKQNSIAPQIWSPTQHQLRAPSSQKGEEANEQQHQRWMWHSSEHSICWRSNTDDVHGESRYCPCLLPFPRPIICRSGGESEGQILLLVLNVRRVGRR